MVEANKVLITLRDKLLEILRTYIDKRHLEKNSQFVYSIHHADAAQMLLFCDQLIPYHNTNQLEGYFKSLLNDFEIETIHPECITRLIKLGNALIKVKAELEKK